MGDKTNRQWAFIFHQLGQDNLRKMLFKAAMRKDEEERVVIEFDGENAMDVTDHLTELENDIT